MSDGQAIGVAGGNPLHIHGDMGIYRAGELRGLVLDALQHSPALELDLTRVTEFDAAGLQLLIMADRAARAAGGSMRITGCSEVVRATLDLLGLAPGGLAVLDPPCAVDGRVA